jgi:hypothetical protein
LVAVAVLSLVGARKPATTEPIAEEELRAGKWVDVGHGVRARAFLGFWMGENRPGEAGKVVRLLRESEIEHFGVTIELEVPRGFTGELKYRERLALPKPARTWGELDEEMVRRGITREVSGDAHAATIREPLKYKNGVRVWPSGDLMSRGQVAPFFTYTFDAGDPPGEWSVECWVNDKSIGRFRFEVVIPEDGVKEPVVVSDGERNRERPRVPEE